MKNNSFDILGSLVSGIFSISLARVFVNYFNFKGESLDFILVAVSLLSFFGIEFLRKLLRGKFSWEFLVLAIISFFQSYFLNYSVLHFGVYIFLCFVVWYFQSRISLVNNDLYGMLNSVFFSLPVFFILRSFSYSLLVFGVFLLMSVISRFDVRIVNKLFKNDFGFITVVGLFLSNSLFSQFVIILFVILVGFFFSIRNFVLKKYLYSYSALFLFVYNPLFSMGKIDTVEEGFWMAWWQRLIAGEIGYRDFWMYHPPILLNILNIIGTFFGESVYVMRSFFELMKLIGMGLIFYIISVKYRNLLTKVVVFLLIVVMLESLVRNNVEIRLGVALLSVYIVSLDVVNKKFQWLVTVFSGLLCGISLGISLETGISALFASFVVISLRCRRRFGTGVEWGLGVLVGIFSWGINMVFQSAGMGFMQMYEYARGFSLGYLSEQIPLPISGNLLRIENVIGYFSGNDILWIVGLLAVLVVWRLLIVDIKNDRSYWTIGMGLFILGMTRVALGRSDWQHLVFVLIPVVLLGGFFIDGLEKRKRVMGTVAILTCLFVFGKQQLSQHIGSILVRWQSYGVFTGTTTGYSSNRSDIRVSGDFDLSDENRLFEYLNTEFNNSYLFAFPWKPEMYFLTGKINPTKSDVPLAYLSDSRQNEIIDQLEAKKNNVVILYGKSTGIGGLGVDSLKKVNEYILRNYSVVREFKTVQVMVYFEGGKDK